MNPNNNASIKFSENFSLMISGDNLRNVALASLAALFACGSLGAQTKVPATNVTAQQILEVENVRSQDVSLLIAATKSSNAKLQQAAVRAMGRMERASLRDDILLFMKSPNAMVRTEAASALGQINAQTDYARLLSAEKVGAVRAELFTTVGRVLPTVAGAEQTLTAGLMDESPDARAGAARGLESLFRLNRGTKPSAETVAKLRDAFVANGGEAIREFILLTLNAAGDRDQETLARAARDTSAEVRRLAVMAQKEWIANDPAPMVRYQMLRAVNTCDQAMKVAGDLSEHVVLAMIDMIGSVCKTEEQIKDAVQFLDHFKTLKRDRQMWRYAAHGLVSLAKLKPESAREAIPAFASDTIWQVRVYAATAARITGDTVTLNKLAHDAQPNVAIEAMTTPADALRALTSNHAGLVRAGALKLKGSSALQSSMPQIVAALDRLTNMNRATTRDPRIALLERINEGGDASAAEYLRPLLNDVDPAVAKLAATIISAKSGTKVDAKTTEYAIIPVPSVATIAALQGATATIVMKGLGTVKLELYADDAPLTVAKFAELADKGAYGGLTFHRIVSNFVIQGGSPGADEYDGITRDFMRDEVGLRSHLRGTLGISTRGHDTGDGQIFINLVDNFRLDHQYTVFARVTSGMDIVDRVQEGAVMESVKIIRKK